MKFQPGNLVVIKGHQAVWVVGAKLTEQNKWEWSNWSGRMVDGRQVALYIDYVLGPLGHSSLDIILLGDQFCAINIGRLELYK